ncbi:hypothetical protein HYV74_01415 [Candidatus Uhrbacteria bacterium]|nr:hypothetical protein [Candidatus Uhrbacteria bacterium]
MRVTLTDCLAQFPHRAIRPEQQELLAAITATPESITIEGPTGLGKTDVAMSVLRARAATVAQELRDRQATNPAARPHPRWYCTPTKNEVEQIQHRFPEVRVIYGRNEYPCAYYHARGMPLAADAVPCATLRKQHCCPHAIVPETGLPEDPHAEPCAYLAAKHAAKSGGIVVTTTAFFLTSSLLARDWETPDTVVMDEADQLADIASQLFATHITDSALLQILALLERINDAHHADLFRTFLDILQRHTSRTPGESKILEPTQTIALIQLLERAHYPHLHERIQTAMRSGVLDPVQQQSELRILEDLTRNILRYLRHLRFAVGDADRGPRNLAFAYAVRERADGTMVCRLVIEPYLVNGLIRAAVGDHVLAMSATIGDGTYFGYETGLTAPVYRVARSPFPIHHRRIYLPIDTPDLAHRAQERNTLRDAVIRILDCCAKFRARGHRALIVTMSNAERDHFVRRAPDAGLTLISYGNGVTARNALERFVQGEGDVLVGTSAQFATGIDLPKQIAPIIVALRPKYSNPHDPRAQFEELQRLSKGKRFARERYRATKNALQVSGRNWRTPESVGITIFYSRQFRDLFPQGLPRWLEPAYVSTRTLDQIVEEACVLLDAAPDLPIAASST